MIGAILPIVSRGGWVFGNFNKTQKKDKKKFKKKKAGGRRG
jgi:hypothetical protein